ncbi:hypothetical protein FF38_09943 [Lucilia cuprina]|uniref:Uncharacterized protein n=1 Tax=Lucilia cuprina TaxID=7375 RepID=A0A0L0C956_LUCCU|nr:Transcription factor Ouib [Lucilia cuprina]KNC28777.1 hypothetical protein FF38_09943 [Lucilia cuprina]
MCVVIDLDAVCLICLQPNKEMQPIFTTIGDNTELQIAQQISILSELKIDQHNKTLPRKICGKCLQDLRAAWRFRKNCQAAVTIFQTIVRLGGNQTAEDEIEAKELPVQEVKVPQELQIKCINNDDNVADEVDNKASESLIQKKSAAVDAFVLNNTKENSTLYEELVPHDYVEDQDNQSEEFHNLQQEINESNMEEVDEVEENESDQILQEEQEEGNNVVEYYLTEEALTDDSTIKLHNKLASKGKIQLETKQLKLNKQTTATDERQMKLTEYLEKVNKPTARVRTRGQNVQNVQKVAANARPQTKTIVIEDSNSAEDSQHLPAQPEVRQVKTRKRRTQSPEIKKPKVCELCGNSYRFQHALNAHMRRHYNEKPFPCDFCDKAFVSNVELRRHMRVHTGQKPYACQYCERRFSDFGSRIKHERTHTGERPYHCVTCGKSFAYPHVLSVHVLTHTGEKRFRCEYCSKGFTKKIYLQSHVEQHHNIGADFQVVIDESSQNQVDNNSMKGENFQDCIFTTEYVNEEAIEEADGEYEEENEQDPGKIMITQTLMHSKIEADDDDDVGEMHEIVEVEPEEEYS